jgi:hypothetical protein
MQPLKEICQRRSSTVIISCGANINRPISFWCRPMGITLNVLTTNKYSEFFRISAFSSKWSYSVYTNHSTLLEQKIQRHSSPLTKCRKGYVTTLRPLRPTGRIRCFAITKSGALPNVNDNKQPVRFL